MRDYGELVKALRYCADRPICFSSKCPYRTTSHVGSCFDFLKQDAADAIEELLAICKEIAAFVIHYADDDEVSAEVLCRKLHKIGLIEKEGAWWTLPEPPKEVV